MFRFTLIRDQRTAQFNECEGHQLLSNMVLSRVALFNIVVQVRTAPAAPSASETKSAESGSTRAIMFPPRPPPESFAPSAPASRAAPTRSFNSGEDTVKRLSR